MNLTHALVLLGVLLTPMLVTASFQFAKKTVKMITAKRQQSKIRDLICEVTQGIVQKRKFLPPEKSKGVAREVLPPSNQPVFKKGWRFNGGSTSFIILNKKPGISFSFAGKKKIEFTIIKILDNYYHEDDEGVVTHLNDKVSEDAQILFDKAIEFANQSAAHFRAKRRSLYKKSVAIELV